MAATDTSTAAAQINTVIDSGRIDLQRFLIVLLCLSLNMVDGFDVTAMSITANAIGGELGLAADRIGFIFSFALAGMVMGAMFLAAVSDLIGRRLTIVLSAFVVAGTVFVTGYASTLPQLIGLRFVSGLGAGALLASQAALAAEYCPDRFRALAVTTVTAGYPLGAMLTGVLAGYIMPDYGWRGMFFFGGAATFVMAVVALAFLPESLKFLLEKRPPGALEKINKILARFNRRALSELPTADQPHARSTVVGNMRELLAPEHKRSTLNLWLSFIFCFCALYFLMSWIPALMVNSGFSEETGQLAFFLFNLGGLIGLFLLGGLSTNWRLSNVVSLFMLAAAAGMIIFAIAPSNRSLLLALIFVIGVTQQGGLVGLYGVAAKIYPTGIRSTGVGWGIGLGRTGAVVGPAIAGVLIAGGVSMEGNFMIFAVPMALAGIIAYLLRVK